MKPLLVIIAALLASALVLFALSGGEGDSAIQEVDRVDVRGSGDQVDPRQALDPVAVGRGEPGEVASEEGAGRLEAASVAPAETSSTQGGSDTLVTGRLTDGTGRPLAQGDVYICLLYTSPSPRDRG